MSFRQKPQKAFRETEGLKDEPNMFLVSMVIGVEKETGNVRASPELDLH